MNCQTFRQRLDCLTAKQRAVDVEVASHLDGCSDCRQFLAATDRFDQRVSSVLKTVPMAEDFLDRLLTVVEEDSSAEPLPIAKRIRHSRAFTIVNRLIVTGLAIAVIFAASSLWSPDPVESQFDYAVAKSELTQKFFHITDNNWSDLAAFDYTGFQIGRLDSAVQKWSFSEPVGLDLGNDATHDVVAFQFSYEKSQRLKWSGTLLVLPTEKFNGTPQETLPGSSSGMQILEWQSADGSLTYLCFVEEGSADELAGTMFGSIS